MVFNITSFALIFTTAAIGISETSYLIRKRVAAEKPVCPIGEGCDIVLKSRYNRMFFGLHNDIAGMIFYIAIAALAALIVLEAYFVLRLVLLMEFLLVAASLMSAAFLYIQWRMLKAWCFWCVMSAATIGLMDLIISFQVFI